MYIYNVHCTIYIVHCMYNECTVYILCIITKYYINICINIRIYNIMVTHNTKVTLVVCVIIVYSVRVYTLLHINYRSVYYVIILRTSYHVTSLIVVE